MACNGCSSSLTEPRVFGHVMSCGEVRGSTSHRALAPLPPLWASVLFWRTSGVVQVAIDTPHRASEHPRVEVWGRLGHHWSRLTFARPAAAAASHRRLAPPAPLASAPLTAPRSPTPIHVSGIRLVHPFVRSSTSTFAGLSPSAPAPQAPYSSLAAGCHPCSMQGTWQSLPSCRLIEHIVARLSRSMETACHSRPEW